MPPVKELVGKSDVVAGCGCKRMVSRFFVQRDQPGTLISSGGLTGRNTTHRLLIGLYRLEWLFQRVKEFGSVLRFPNPTLRK